MDKLSWKDFDTDESREINKKYLPEDGEGDN